MLSESNRRITDLLTLEPAIPSLDQIRMRSETDSGAVISQETPGFAEEEDEEAERDFLPQVEVKIEGEEQVETPELEEMIDLASFTDSIYICEVRFTNCPTGRPC